MAIKNNGNFKKTIITMANKDNNEGELPKLNIEQENEFKKLKLSLEHGAEFLDFKSKTDLPPEIEGQFLDYISNFETAFKNAKPISVYEKIGKPEFKAAATLSDDELVVELERIEAIMRQNNLNLDVLCDYENEGRLIYTFITEELFLSETDDMNVFGMTTNFIYEEFHQNHKYDIEHGCADFLRSYFDKTSDFYEQYMQEDAENHIELNHFRTAFDSFSFNKLETSETTFGEENGITTFEIDFSGIMEGSHETLSFIGKGTMSFNYKYGYWYVKNVKLPSISPS
jgi:hypothetical protein